MIKLLKQALFVIPIASIVAAPVALHLKNKDVKHESSVYMSKESGQTSSIFSNLNPFSTPSENEDYSMSEPFAVGSMGGMTYSMKKSMDPNTWMQMMTNMMNPYGTSPEAMCASCHEAEDLARYQKQFGPMMQSSWNQFQTMMDPHGMAQMMNPTMMTQMMHQMMSMPTQMMMPMMGMNPHMSVPGMASSTTPNVMSPEQYEQWYNEQQKKLEQNQ